MKSNSYYMMFLVLETKLVLDYWVSAKKFNFW